MLDARKGSSGKFSLPVCCTSKANDCTVKSSDADETTNSHTRSRRNASLTAANRPVAAVRENATKRQTPEECKPFSSLRVSLKRHSPSSYMYNSCKKRLKFLAVSRSYRFFFYLPLSSAAGKCRLPHLTRTYRIVVGRRTIRKIANDRDTLDARKQRETSLDEKEEKHGVALPGLRFFR